MPLLSKLLQNTSLLFVTNLLNRATTALLFILIARILGPADSGLFTLGVTYSLILVLPLIGLEDFLVRELVRHIPETRRYVTNFLAARFTVTFSLYVLLAVILLNYAPYPDRTIQLILLMASSALPEGLFVTGQSVFFAHDRFRYPVAISLLVMVLKTAGGAIALGRGWGLEVIGLIYVGGSWVGAILSISGAVMLARDVPGHWRLNLSFCYQLLRSGTAFILMGILTGLELQLDVLLLSYLTDETAVGWYSAASTVFVTLALLPMAYRMAVFPIMTRLALASSPQLFRLYEKSIYYILFISLPLIVGVSLIAPTLLRLIYRDEFGPSVLMVQILIWALIFLFVNVPSTRLLLVLDLQRWVPTFLLVSLFINIVANLVLIPYLAGVGSALARIISTGSYTVLSLSMLARSLKGQVTFQWLKLVPRILIATTVMGLVVAALASLPLVIVISAGIGAYLLVAAAIGMIPLDDRQLLRKLIPL